MGREERYQLVRFLIAPKEESSLRSFERARANIRLGITLSDLLRVGSFKNDAVDSVAILNRKFVTVALQQALVLIIETKRIQVPSWKRRKQIGALQKFI